MKILPQDKNELVQWLFIAGSVVSIVAMVHQIKVNRLQLTELQKKHDEEQHLSYVPSSPAASPGLVKMIPDIVRGPGHRKHDIFCLWKWYNPVIS